MELRNIGGAVGGTNAVNHPPVNPGVPVGRRPAFPEGQEVPASPGGPDAAPHAAPPEKVVIQTQQLVADALRELKLPETPLNLAIAETLRQMDQAISGSNIQLVSQALRALASQSADDVAAAVILLMHELPVTKENVAALRQLMNGESLPGQFAKLESQLQQLTGKLATIESQLATVPQNPNAPPPAANQAAMLNVALPPGVILPQQLQAAAAAAQAVATSDDAPAVAEVGESSSESAESPEEGDTTGAASTAPTGGMAMGSMQRRGEQEPLKRALGGGIGSLGDQASPGEPEATGTEPTATTPEGSPGEARPAGLKVNPSAARKPGDGEAANQQGQSQARSDGKPMPAKLTQPTSGGTIALSPRGMQSQPGTSTQAGAKAGTPAAQPGTTPTPTTPTPAAAATTAAKAGTAPAANPPASSQVPGQPSPAPAGSAAKAAPATGENPAPPPAMAPADAPPPPPLPPLAPRVQATMQLLKGMTLASTMGEPAHLGQQMAALKELYGPVQDALKRMGGDVLRHLQALGPLEQMEPQQALQALARLVGRSFAQADPSPEQQQALMQLATDIHEVLQQAGTTVKEAIQQLHAREQLAQSSQVYCVPLSLPGQRSVELLIEPDEEHQRRREGGSPYRIRLAVDTHHLGPVGIDVTSWQQNLRIQLQVSDARVQAKLAFAQELLEKALARAGFVSAQVGVSIAQSKPQNSLLLPERTYARSLNRIEGVV